jgi:S1-C subfamily serine protease
MMHFFNAGVLLSIAILASGAANAKDTDKLYKVGAGFFVNRGYVLTNRQIVQNCSRIFLHGAANGNEAIVAINDKKNDLVLLRSNAVPISAATFRTNSVAMRRGMPVMVPAYLSGKKRDNQLQVGQAQVVDRNSVDKEQKNLVFSSIVMPGAIGAPVLDSSGNVVGVVSVKPKDYMQSLESKNNKMINNIFTSTNGQHARELLNEAKIPFLEADSNLHLTPKEISEKAKSYIVTVHCTYDDTTQKQKKRQKNPEE